MNRAKSEERSKAQLVRFLWNNQTPEQKYNFVIANMNTSAGNALAHYNNGDEILTNPSGLFNEGLSTTNSNSTLISPSPVENNMSATVEQSSPNGLLLWAIVCDVIGAPCSIMFLYVVYRGIEVSNMPPLL